MLGIMFKGIVSFAANVALLALLVDAVEHNKKSSIAIVLIFFTVLIYNVIK